MQCVGKMALQNTTPLRQRKSIKRRVSRHMLQRLWRYIITRGVATGNGAKKSLGCERAHMCFYQQKQTRQLMNGYASMHACIKRSNTNSSTSKQNLKHSSSKQKTHRASASYTYIPNRTDQTLILIPHQKCNFPYDVVNILQPVRVTPTVYKHLKPRIRIWMYESSHQETLPKRIIHPYTHTYIHTDPHSTPLFNAPQ